MSCKCSGFTFWPRGITSYKVLINFSFYDIHYFQEATKSDWMFKRARDRKRFHRLAAAEWHNRRLLTRLDCEDEDDEGCEDVGKVNSYLHKHHLCDFGDLRPWLS